MAATTTTTSLLLLFFCTILLGPLPPPVSGGASSATQHQQQFGHNLVNHQSEKGSQWEWKNHARRLMIGSTAPTCTYNECRGCRFKCRAEQIPVDANDPINTAYHYKCVCHR